MTRADNTIYLLQAAAARHHNALAKAHAAVEELDRTGEAVTFAAVARTAGVSRSWLYNQGDLRAAIIDLRTSSSPTRGRLPAAQRATADSIRQRLDTARDEITRLRGDNTALRDQLARCLGDRRARP